MQRTNIDYLTHTWNPIAMRCTPVSPGSANYWHLRMCKRKAKNPRLTEDVQNASSGGPPVLIEKELATPLTIRESAMIGVQYMGDLFYEAVTFENIDSVWWTMSVAREHVFLVLTKRPERCLEYWQHRLALGFTDGNRKNIWLGTSCENQEWADKRIPELLKIPAAVRFLSLEPLLSEINIKKYLTCGPVGVECGHEHTNKSQTSRRTSNEGREERGNSNRQPRADMACQDEKGIEEQAGGNTNNRSQTATGRKHGTEVPSSQADVEREANARNSSSAGMEVFQRQDSVGFDDQSQERDKDRQPAQKFGVGHVFTTDTAHAGCAEKGEGVESMGGEKRKCQAHERSSGRDQGDVCRRETHPKSDRREIRGSISDNISNSQGEQSYQTGGALQGLHISPTETNHAPQQQGPIQFCIIGCESGPGARPCKLEWVHSIVEQCKTAGVPVWVKQIPINGKANTNMDDWPEWARVRQLPN